MARCKADTLLVTVTLAGASAQATSLVVSVSVAQAAPIATTIAHHPGTASGTVEIDFTSFPVGKTVVVQVSAPGAGSGTGSVTLGAGCATVAITVASTVVADAGVDASGRDLAGADLSGAPPQDLANADLTGAPLQDMACIPKTENCFNGIDDDCDGKVDCADPDCTATATCVPAGGGGFVYGTLLSGTPACPQSGATATTIYNNFSNGGTSCVGCTCSADISGCSNALDVGSPASCSPNTAAGTFEGSVSSCITIPNSTEYSSSSCSCSTSDCSNAGSPSLPTAGMTTDEFCASAAVGGGCGVNMVCAPKVGSGTACLMGASGSSCPTTYGTVTNWNTGFDDGRMCAACSGCYIPPNAHCYLTLWPTADCTGATGYYSMVENQNLCDSGFIGASTLPGECIGASSALSGSVTGTGAAKVVCCQ